MSSSNNKQHKRWWPVALGIAVLIALQAQAGFGVDPWSIAVMVGLAVWTYRQRAVRPDVDHQVRQIRFGAMATGWILAVGASTVLSASWDIGPFIALPLLVLGLVTQVMARARIRRLSLERAQV